MYSSIGISAVTSEMTVIGAQLDGKVGMNRRLAGGIHLIAPLMRSSAVTDLSPSIWTDEPEACNNERT